MRKFFKTDAKPLGRIITDEQEAFVKLLIENPSFRSFFCISMERGLFENIGFTPYEIGDVRRTVREMYKRNAVISYESVLDEMRPRYEGNDLSWEIIVAIMGECESMDPDGIGVWENIFKTAAGEIGDGLYSDSRAWC